MSNSKLSVYQTRAADFDNIDSILDVEGIDIVFIGPYDLSQSLGVNGQTKHPIVVNAMEELVNKAKLKNRTLGTFVESIEDLKMWRDLGIQYLSYKVDVGIFYDTCSDIYMKTR